MDQGGRTDGGIDRSALNEKGQQQGFDDEDEQDDPEAHSQAQTPRKLREST